MKKILLCILMAFIFMPLARSQKLYVFPVNDYQVQPRKYLLKDVPVNIIVFDGRTMPRKSKVDFSSEEVVAQVAQTVVMAYPDAKITIKNTDEYYAPADSGVVTIRISVNGYHAGFGTDIDCAIGSVGGNFSYGISAKGKWNAIVGYYITIDDRRGDSKRYKENVSGFQSHSNMLGYSTAKRCLTDAFVQATDKLLMYIDGIFME